MLEGDFWLDIEYSTKIQKRLKILKEKIEKNIKIEELFSNSQILIEFIEMGDKSSIKELERDILELESLVHKLEIETLFSSRYDENNAIISIQAGTGGQDAQSFAGMLMRMYLRYFDKNSFKVEAIDILEDEEEGIKHATFLVEGDYVYGKLKSETGVHRLVRISPFNSSGKRQTSFAAVDVYPEIDFDEDLKIDNEDLKIDTYRSGGAGGQHVNTTDSAVRITHLPTGIVVQCQNQRSQITNKETAMKMLYSKLYEKKMLEEKESIENIKSDSKKIAWGSQIRSYVLHPYSMVKDHRTNYETGNVSNVLDGDIDGFIESYLKRGEYDTY